ncbi:hypothetical protein ACFE04_024187 [Oxalis oulophora]
MAGLGNEGILILRGTSSSASQEQISKEYEKAKKYNAMETRLKELEATFPTNWSDPNKLWCRFSPVPHQHALPTRNHSSEAHEQSFQRLLALGSLDQRTTIQSLSDNCITNDEEVSNDDNCVAVTTLVLVIGLNLAIGFLPHIENSAHIGGFISGFLLGFILLLGPQYGYVSRMHIPCKFVGILSSFIEHEPHFSKCSRQMDLFLQRIDRKHFFPLMGNMAQDPVSTMSKYLNTWNDYYEWRGIPLHSLLDILLQWVFSKASGGFDIMVPINILTSISFCPGKIPLSIVLAQFSASLVTYAVIQAFTPDLIINAGTAGDFKVMINLGHQGKDQTTLQMNIVHD